MECTEKHEIRKISDKKWYWISHSILKKYGRLLKSSGLAVYNVLASYANSKSQSCFPSQKTIAEKIGLCRETVNRKIKLLKINGLIKIKRIKGHCLYFLLRSNVILNHSECDRHITGSVESDHINNNKEIKLFNKNKAVAGNHVLKPIRQLLKRYE